MTGYSDEDFLRDFRRWDGPQIFPEPTGCRCWICGEYLEYPGEYHSDECILIDAFVTGIESGNRFWERGEEVSQEGRREMVGEPESDVQGTLHGGTQRHE